MRVLPIFPRNWFGALIPALEPHGITVAREAEPVDAIIVGSVSQLPRALEAMKAMPDVPMYAYNWDLYEWQKRAPGYDWAAWGRLLRHCREVWHPGPATLKRCKEWYGIGGRVIETFVPLDHLRDAPKMVHDGGYALMALRESPDPGRRWFAQACEIPWRTTDLALEPGEFAEVLAGATLLVNPLREASTGGLFLLEGLSLGKPALVSASPWNDGAFYLGPFARRPKIDSYEAFRAELGRMWEERKVFDFIGANTYVHQRFSVEAMAAVVAKRLKA